jgi:hypothetical protein
LSALVALGVIAISNWAVDPLQHYRAASYPPLLVEPQRYRLPGVARHVAGDVIVCGTSVSVNQRSEEVSRIFGGKVLNLAMDGASAHEQFLLLRLTLRHHAPREVIWDINFEYLRGSPEWVSDYDGAFPAYLYDESFWNDVPHYLLNLDTCKNTGRVLARMAGVPAYADRTLESFRAATPTEYGPAAVSRAMERRRQHAEEFRATLPDYRPELLRENFLRNYVALIREYPQTKFHLYFAPFSRAYFGFLHEAAPELLRTFADFRQEITDLATKAPNPVLHDPQSDLSLVKDLSHYRDPIHFDDATHTVLLEGIHDARWQASLERLTAFRAWLEAGRF